METLYNCAYNGMTICVRAIMESRTITPDLTALHYALDMGHSTIATMLMDHGAMPDQVKKFIFLKKSEDLYFKLFFKPLFIDFHIRSVFIWPRTRAPSKCCSAW